MEVSQFMELVDSSKHFRNIKSGMLLFQDTGIIQQGAEIPSRNVFHCKIYILWILEGIKEADKPWCFCRRQNVSFNKNMSNLETLPFGESSPSESLANDVPRPSYVKSASASSLTHKPPQNPAFSRDILHHSHLAQPVR